MSLTYVLKRLIHSLLVLVVVVLAVFALTQMVGDPARLMLNPETPHEQYLALRQSLGLDDPLPVRLVRFLRDVARGDFGNSLWQRVPAMPATLQRLPATLTLAFVTILIAVPIALGLGLVSAVRPRSALDRFVTVLAFGGLSVAEFWVGIMLILVFAIGLRWLPTSGAGDWRYLVLPAITLALRPIGRISQIVRSSMLDELARPYVTTARAKGLAEPAVTIGHAFRNAGVPTLTLAASEMASLLNGAVVIETVFGWPGIGSLLIGAIERRDLPLIESTVFVIAVMVVALNLLVDLAYSALDPRVRY